MSTTVITSLEKIDKLNETVARKTKQAVEAARGGKAQLAPEHVASGRKMSVAYSGFPVYQPRSHALVWAYCCVASLMLARGAPQLGVPMTVLCAAVMFLAYDLYSGVLHVVLDHPGNIALPFFGQACLEFQWHHHIPDDICKKDFWDVLGDLNVVVGLLTAIHFCWSSQWGADPLALVLTGCKLFMAYFGQYSHKSAHNVNHRGPVAKALQRAGLMISTKEHARHHAPPYELDFCLVGVCNPVIDAMRQVTTHPTVWLGLLVVWSVVDVKLLALALVAAV